MSYRHRTLLLGLGRDKQLSAQQQIEYLSLCPKRSKPAKSLAPQRRRGLVQRRSASAPMRRCCMFAAPVALVFQPDKAHPNEISRCVVVLPNWAASQPVIGLLTKAKDKYGRMK